MCSKSCTFEQLDLSCRIGSDEQLAVFSRRLRKTGQGCPVKGKDMLTSRILCVVSIFLAIGLVGWVTDTGAAEHDISTQITGPTAAGPGGVASITVSYHNAGPDSAVNSYINAWIPSGLPVPLDELTQDHWDALAASIVPDGLGNTGYLFLDTGNCGHLVIQVQEDVGPVPAGSPIVGFDPGVTGSVSFEVAMPMDPPNLAGLVIENPPSLAKKYMPAAGLQYIIASDLGRHAVATCDPLDECTNLSLCFGPRLWNTTPIAGDLELVNDGTADPTWGCESLVGFTPGNIAVIERASCEFGLKALNAQNAGATAVIMVNDGRCSSLPDSTQCVINMGGGVEGDQVTIPSVMLSVDDGQPIIDALVGATTVQASMGNVIEVAAIDSVGLYLATDTDPDLRNNYDSLDVSWWAIFTDGFDSGDAAAWSNVVPPP